MNKIDIEKLKQQGREEMTRVVDAVKQIDVDALKAKASEKISAGNKFVRTLSPERKRLALACIAGICIIGLTIVRQLPTKGPSASQVTFNAISNDQIVEEVNKFNDRVVPQRSLTERFHVGRVADSNLGTKLKRFASVTVDYTRECVMRSKYAEANHSSSGLMQLTDEAIEYRMACDWATGMDAYIQSFCRNKGIELYPEDSIAIRRIAHGMILMQKLSVAFDASKEVGEYWTEDLRGLNVTLRNVAKSQILVMFLTCQATAYAKGVNISQLLDL
jgi:hypothetical protein